MEIPFFWVDAFTDKPFKGNPAVVCLVDQWLHEATMQKIAFENNLSETAFVVERDSLNAQYELRWFTPASEVDLCGHATLASAHVLFSMENIGGNSITFHTKSGPLHVTRNNDLLMMDFPAREPVPVACPNIIPEALGAKPEEVLKSRDLMVVLDSAETVKNLQPNIELLSQIKDFLGIIVTAPDEKYDFVSRFFAPNVGVPEDPVTGSAHCTLIPYWSKKLNKRELMAYQASWRSGEIYCEYKGERVVIGGKAVLYARGEIIGPEVD